MVRQKLRFLPLAHLHGDEHFALLWEGHPVFFFLMGMYMSSSSFRLIAVRQKLRLPPLAHLQGDLHDV